MTSRDLRGRRPWAILVAGDPVERVRAKRGGYPDILRAAAGDPPVPWLAVDLRDESPLPALASLAAVVITGSASSVTERAPWMLRAEGILRLLVAARVPTLGICFGHQLLGQALGGEVIGNPRGREIGTVTFEVLEDDPLLAAARAPFEANGTHVDTIGRLPAGARVLARTALEANAAVRFGERAWGVQFHPEADGAILRDTIDLRREILLREGLDPTAIIERVTDADAGRSTLLRFVDIVVAAEHTDAGAPEVQATAT